MHAGDILCTPFSPDPPALTIALLQAYEVRAIPGNHDRYLLDWGTPRWPHPLWMRVRRSGPIGPWLDDLPAGQAEIRADDLGWLRALPEELRLDEGRVYVCLYVCHGMPGNPFNCMWPSHPTYDAHVSDADRAASLRLLEGAEIALCGHVATPWELHDHLLDGRELRVIRPGFRSGPGTVGYAVLTRDNADWQVQWGTAQYPTVHPGRTVPPA